MSNAGADAHQRIVDEAVGKARDLLIDAGVDACVIAVTYSGEDAVTRTTQRNYGNWHTQTGLIVNMYERRKRAAHNEQTREDADCDEA